MARRLFTLSFIPFSLAAMMVVHTVFISDAWQTRDDLSDDLNAIKQKNTNLESEIHRLMGRVRGLRHRAKVQEHVVRDELGYVKSGDIVIELSKDSEL